MIAGLMGLCLSGNGEINMMIMMMMMMMMIQLNFDRRLATGLLHCGLSKTTGQPDCGSGLRHCDLNDL